MKKKLITMIVLSFVLTSGSLFAQIEAPSEPTLLQGDTLLVFPTYNDSKWDALNKWISYGGKLDSAGTPVNVYMLANNETYELSHVIVTQRPLSICAQQKPDAENAPPLVVAATDLNNEFPAAMIQNNGPVTIRNIYFCGADIEEPTLGAATQSQYIIQTTKDSTTNVVDGCYFEWMGGDGAAFSSGARYINLTFTNNMVFNCGGNGTAWWSTWAGYTVNFGGNPAGDIVIRNNTTMNSPGPFFINWHELTRSLVIEHNTVINNTIYCLFNSTWTDAELKSNIFYNCGVQGVDIQRLQVASDSLLNWGIAYVDTLSTYRLDSAYAAQIGVDKSQVESHRKLALTDNYYGWSSEVLDYWNSADSLKKQVWMNSRVQQMFADDTHYPLFTESGTFSKDQYGEPQFVGGYGGATTMDSLISYIRDVITGDGTKTSPTRFYYTPGEGDPQPNPAMVWPLGYNLAVGNSALVGSDGKPLGDLNWYPEYAERWDPELVTSVKTTNTSIPDVFKLGQNYPNPFNPTTKIEFSIPQSGNVSLKVFNVLGQEVATLVKGHMNAGTYKVDFYGSNLTSGVYFYRIETAKNSVSKKMLLLK